MTTDSKKTDAPLDTNEVVSLRINKLIPGGQGMGRLEDGRVIFTEGVVPGDVLEGTVVKQKRQFKLMESVFSKTSNDRVQPKCKHAGVCGGCDWQMVSDEAQAHWKTEIVRESLMRLAKVKEPTVQPIITRAEWAYRHTVNWQVTAGRIPRLAYFVENSHDHVEFDECPVLASALANVAESLNGSPWLLTGCITVKGRSTVSGEVLLTVTVAKHVNSKDALSDWQRWIDDKNLAVGIRLLKPALPQPVTEVSIETDLAKKKEASTDNNTAPKANKHADVSAGDEYLTETLGLVKLSYADDHFMQGHPGAFKALMQWVKMQPEIKALQHRPGALLDGFCGIGVLGFNLKAPVHWMVGVEDAQSAIDWAKYNAKTLGVEAQCTFAHQSMEDYIKKESDSTFMWAVIDPPRQGLKPWVQQWLAQQVSDVIVMVSCDPATMARDTKAFIESGWVLNTVQPVDLFPQTHHVETVCIFSRA